MQRRPVVVDVTPSPDGVAPLVRALEALLDGDPAPVVPGVAGDPAPPAPLPDGTVVLRTSGSTGRPRAVVLDPAALLASADATRRRIGAGPWLLALPAQHVAGLQVLVRGLTDGLDVLDLRGGFDPAALLAAVRPGARVSLVPTQLHRLLAHDVAPLRDAVVLLGGAAAAPALLDRARAAGLHVVTTYGMTETSGGCVYDGVPLDGVDVALDDRVVRLAGPVLARGYVPDEPGFVERDGRRWFVTRDLAEWRDGRLHVLGRVDDVVVTGGVNVAPAAVERVLAGLPAVGEVCVVGVPDPEWGQAVTAVVVPAPGRPAPALAELRDAARTLGPAAAPRHLVLVEALPLRGPGKVDRAAVVRRAQEELHGDDR